MLAVLTSLLILNGCDNTDTAERAGEQVDQAAQTLRERSDPVINDAPAPAEESGRTLDDAGERPGITTE